MLHGRNPRYASGDGDQNFMEKFDISFATSVKQFVCCIMNNKCKIVGFACVLLILATILNMMKTNTSNAVQYQLLEGKAGINEVATIENHLTNLQSRALSLELAIQQISSQLQLYSRGLPSSELPDFASESAGGAVLDTPDTESVPESNNLYLFGIPLARSAYTPRKVIQPWTQPGECWAFKGKCGKVEIELAYTITITAVTVEHIPVSLSLTGTIDSAPRHMSLQGYYKSDYVPYDKFEYKKDGAPSQTFFLKSVNRNLPVKKVMFSIHSNWGNECMTCIYRLKVHGNLHNDLHFDLL